MDLTSYFLVFIVGTTALGGIWAAWVVLDSISRAYSFVIGAGIGAIVGVVLSLSAMLLYIAFLVLFAIVKEQP